MDELYELLQKIKESPGLYLGKKTLEGLHYFLNGYMTCLRLYNPSYVMCPGCITGFQEYVQKRYGITSTHNWARIIDFYSSSDEDAFDTFFDLLDEFLKASGSRASA